jgi:hypothetical protein
MLGDSLKLVWRNRPSAISLVENAAAVDFVQDCKGPNDAQVSLWCRFSTDALVYDCEIDTSSERERDHFLFASSKVAQRGINPRWLENPNPVRRLGNESANRNRRFGVP